MTTWDIYSIESKQQLHGVKLRGRIRLFAIRHQIELLTENAADTDNTVRFALQYGLGIEEIEAFIESIIPDAKIVSVLSEVKNPVLSKLAVNKGERYE